MGESSFFLQFLSFHNFVDLVLFRNLLHVPPGYFPSFAEHTVTQQIYYTSYYFSFFAVSCSCPYFCIFSSPSSRLEAFSRDSGPTSLPYFSLVHCNPKLNTTTTALLLCDVYIQHTPSFLLISRVRIFFSPGRLEWGGHGDSLGHSCAPTVAQGRPSALWGEES